MNPSNQPKIGVPHVSILRHGIHAIQASSPAKRENQSIMTKFRIATLILILVFPALLLAEADGKWLHRVPDEDHNRHNPIADQPAAASAGQVIFSENCAKCHGKDADGLHGRPGLRSDRVRKATDGDLAWMLKNGNPYKNMPPWSSLPEQQRWQIIAYIRTLPISTHPAKP